MTSNWYADEYERDAADIAKTVPVERMSLGDWRRLMESTPGRLPTCGEMGRASEKSTDNGGCSSEVR